MGAREREGIYLVVAEERQETPVASRGLGSLVGFSLLSLFHTRSTAFLLL